MDLNLDPLRFFCPLRFKLKEPWLEPKMMDFMPHGACYLWDGKIILLHVVSDAGIALAYLCLPLLLWHFSRKRKDIPFSWLFAMFGAFILSCGSTHLMGIWTLWHPSYLADGLLKLATAVISLMTAIALFTHLPEVIALPSPSQMSEKEQQLEAALKKEREINEFRRRIVSTVAHEYRTPLTSILSSAELVERYPTGKRSVQHFENIRRKITYLSKLIDDALILDKAESGRLEFQPTEIDAISWCSEVLAELDWGKHTLQLSALDEAVGLFDLRLLNALVTNLVYNACKYSDPESIVYVRLQRGNESFILEVEDQGIGIPLEDIPRIFESYFRAANVDSAPGTGVGLSIVQGCVNLHDGTISVVSEVGVGTTFRVVLPLRHGTP